MHSTKEITKNYMKNIALTILILLALGFAAYFAMSKQNSKHVDNQTISPAAIQQIRTTTSMPLYQCKYEGQLVIKADSRPVDGPLVIYALSGKEIGYVTSGFGSPIEATIDESKITDCTDIPTETASEHEQSPSSNQQGTSLNAVIVAQIHSEQTSAYIQECSYKGNLVFIGNSNPSDGPRIMYDKNGIELYNLGGNERAPGKELPLNDFVEADLKECVTVYSNFPESKVNKYSIM